MRRLTRGITRLISLVLAVCWAAGAALGAQPIPLDPEYIIGDTDDVSYGSGNYGFYYQLRDVSGERDRHTIAGAQWFATTYENYLWHRIYDHDDSVTDADRRHSIYRRTLGGQMSEVPMRTLADLLNNFDYVYVDETEPYREWLDAWLTAHNQTEEVDFYDYYANPLETLCLVIPEGTGDMKIDFMNYYARHFPYWWWYDDTTHINPSDPDEDDEDSDVISRDVMEDISLTADGYTVRVSPNTAQRVEPARSLEAILYVRAENPQDYGSTVGYVTFRQSAALAKDSIGWRDPLTLPVVVANVHNGPASELPLLFDMTLFDESATASIARVVDRVRFPWGANADLTQDLGKFYVMQNSSSNLPTYSLETRVTNRTGWRYRLYRYDEIGDTTGDTGPRESFKEIRPNYWAYDLTPDRYGTLPSRFILDEHSQIAPGLVTVYSSDIGSGYRSVNTSYSTSASFRIYPFSGGTPRNLTLRYQRIRGMTAGSWSVLSSAGVGVRPFGMEDFVDQRQNSENTVTELTNLMRATPVLMTPSYITSNLNLGVEGIMFMGGAFGLGGVFYYEKLSQNPNGFVAILIALLCAFLAG
ncbi:MAG: hypothetical protein IJ702_01675, partial [Fretibacterium sp.]|nr:hypothetical protein [Fretibacterium sp.]